MSALLTLDDLDLSTLKGQRVLVRVDFNVPLSSGEVADDTRLVEALPTLRELISAGARCLLVSHCGRPKGTPVAAYSLRPVAARLAELLERPVAFATDCIGPAAESVGAQLEDGACAVLENLRFHAGETKNDPDFAQALAALADVYVDDAFGAAHRAHASVVGVPERLERKAAGRLLVREVAALSRLLTAAQKPFVGIVGGAKIEGKIDTLENLLPHLDALVLGGGMANTFLAARGAALGRSLVERERLAVAQDLLQRAAERGVDVHLPSDLVVADSIEAPGAVETLSVAAGVPADKMALDIGSESRRAFAEVIGEAATVFWNGPMGVFEQEAFAAGTQAVAAAVGACPGYTVIGGGETVAAARRAGVVERIDHVSTGGGASLELLAGRTLPGVAAVSRGD